MNQLVLWVTVSTIAFDALLYLALPQEDFNKLAKKYARFRRWVDGVFGAVGFPAAIVGGVFLAIWVNSLVNDHIITSRFRDGGTWASQGILPDVGEKLFKKHAAFVDYISERSGVPVQVIGPDVPDEVTPDQEAPADDILKDPLA